MGERLGFYEEAETKQTTNFFPPGLAIKSFNRKQKAYKLLRKINNASTNKPTYPKNICSLGISENPL